MASLSYAIGGVTVYLSYAIGGVTANLILCFDWTKTKINLKNVADVQYNNPIIHKGSLFPIGNSILSASTYEQGKSAI